MISNNVLETIKNADSCLNTAGVESSRLEAELLLADCLDVERTFLYLKPELKLTEKAYVLFESRVAERLEGKPLQYILGTQQFRHLLFKVTEDVLIPRLETELLVEHVLKIASSYPPPLKIVDVGTGSGVIALSLAYELPEAIVYALDISKEALKVASENAQNYNLNDKVFFVESDLFSNLKNVLNCPVDVIVSNPPYISSGSLKSLQREVYGFEPLVALDGGENGLEIISRIINESFEYLQPRGCLALEVGFGQAKKVVDLFKQGNCFEEIEIFSDYAGVERFVVGFKKSL